MCSMHMNKYHFLLKTALKYLSIFLSLQKFNERNKKSKACGKKKRSKLDKEIALRTAKDKSNVQICFGSV